MRVVIDLQRGENSQLVGEAWIGSDSRPKPFQGRLELLIVLERALGEDEDQTAPAAD